MFEVKKKIKIRKTTTKIITRKNIFYLVANKSVGKAKLQARHQHPPEPPLLHQPALVPQPADISSWL